MAENNNTNNRNNQFSVTTSLISMFDENSYQLRLAGLESGLSISIWIPTISPDGRITYPIEGRITTIINSDSVASLDYIIKNRVASDWQAGRDFKYGIASNRSMSHIIDIIGVGGEIYLRVSRDVDDSRVAKSVYQFKFTNTNIIVGYDPQSGNFETESIPAQFTMFMEVIGAYNAVTYNAGHGNRVANRFTISSMYNYLQAIAAKLGAVVNTGYQRSYSNNGNNQSNNSYGSTPQEGGYNGQMLEVSSIDALLN